MFHVPSSNQVRAYSIALGIAIALVAYPFSSWCGDDHMRLSKLIDQLDADDDELAAAARDDLVKLALGDESAMAAVIRGLGNKSTNVRISCAIILGRLGDNAKAAIPTLLRVLEDVTEEKEVRYNAGNALGRMNAAVPALAKVLATSTDPFARRRVASAFGSQFIGTNAIPPLIAALGDTDSEVRLIAIGSLEQFQKKAIAPLTDALSHKEVLIRVGAAEALITVDRESVGRAAIVALQAIRHPDPRVRLQACRALESLESYQKDNPDLSRILFQEMQVTSLITALTDEEPGVRYRVATVLGWCGGHAKKVVPALIEALSDKHEYVRGYAAASLGKIGAAAKDAALPLANLAKVDESEEVCIFAISALREIGHPAKEAIPVLQDIQTATRFADSRIGVLLATTIRELMRQ